jgi:hypothetical protein
MIPVTLTIVDIARTCHEVNRAYCAGMGDYSQAPWEDAEDWQRLSAINGVRLHVKQLRKGLPVQGEASHESWLREKVETGWVYWPVKDPVAKTHPCIVPYADLPVEQRMKDALFVSTVTGLFPLLGHEY